MKISRAFKRPDHSPQDLSVWFVWFSVGDCWSLKGEKKSYNFVHTFKFCEHKTKPKICCKKGSFSTCCFCSFFAIVRCFYSVFLLFSFFFVEYIWLLLRRFDTFRYIRSICWWNIIDDSSTLFFPSLCSVSLSLFRRHCAARASSTCSPKKPVSIRWHRVTQKHKDVILSFEWVTQKRFVFTFVVEFACTWPSNVCVPIHSVLCIQKT